MAATQQPFGMRHLTVVPTNFETTEKSEPRECSEEQ